MKPEKRAEAYLAAMQRFDRGEPLVRVDSEELERAWKAVKQLRETFPSTKATGLEAIAGMAGIEYESKLADEVLALTMRGAILSAVIPRGVLEAYLTNGEPGPEVFRAAATMPMTKEDLAEAMLLLHLRDQDPQAIEAFKKEAHNSGYDPVNPLIDAKFLESLKELPNQTGTTDTNGS